VIYSLITSAVLAGIAAGAAALYLLPVLIGQARHVPGLRVVVVVDVALGWTLIGWAIALAMTLRAPRRHAAHTIGRLPPAAPPVSPQRDAGWAGPPGPPPCRVTPPPPLILPPRPPQSAPPGRADRP